MATKHILFNYEVQASRKVNGNVVLVGRTEKKPDETIAGLARGCVREIRAMGVCESDACVSSLVSALRVAEKYTNANLSAKQMPPTMWLVVCVEPGLISQEGLRLTADCLTVSVTGREVKLAFLTFSHDTYTITPRRAPGCKRCSTDNPA